MCMVLGFLILLSVTISLITSAIFLSGDNAPSIPEKAVLFLALDDPLLEHANMAGPYSLQDSGLTSRNVVVALDRAKDDPRIKGFVFGLRGSAFMTLSQIEEIRAAIHRFRESGKFTYFYAPSIDSLGSYYLAAAFEDICIQPMGMMSIPGISAEMPYARDLMNFVGVSPQFFQRKDYKSIYESITEDAMTDKSREALEDMVSTLANTMTTAIQNDRAMTPERLKEAIDLGILLDSEALALGLVDSLCYGDEVNTRIRQSVTGNADSEEPIFASIARYIGETNHQRQLTPVKKPKVAVIYLVGTILQYNDGAQSLGTAETIVGELRAVSESDTIDTIILRVDSPGGDPTASESIRRAVIQAQEKGKTVIVSMGSAAASGGYWLSAPADRIFALPSTFTGSIGVAGGKFSLQDLWSNIFVNWDNVRWGENAGFWSFNEPFDALGRARMNALLDNTYERFIALVASGRNMSLEQAENVAQGRVWLGAQAVNNGLVDELGGLSDALDYVAKSKNLEDRDDLQVVILPRPKTAFERILALLNTQASMFENINAQSGFFNVIRPVIEPFMNAQNAQSGQPVSAYAPLPNGALFNASENQPRINALGAPANQANP